MFSETIIALSAEPAKTISDILEEKDILTRKFIDIRINNRIETKKQI
jgi:hypothetical protein